MPRFAGFLVVLFSARAALACPVPQVMLVVDASGSMRERDRGGEARWDTTVQALAATTRRYGDAVQWGLVIFPLGQEVCTIEAFGSPVPATSERVIDALRAASPGGLTPTQAALELARIQLAAVREEGVPQSIVLVTDGLPNCNEALDPGTCTCTCPQGAPCDCGTDPRTCLDDAATLSTTGALLEDGVRTYVVGFGDEGEALLDELALRGGTARDVPEGSPRHYQARDLDSLEGSLEEILSLAGLVTQPCDADPCGGVQTCTASGWSECRAWVPGEARACSGEGTCGAREVCTGTGFGPCTPVEAGEQRSCTTRCGSGVQTCRADGGWDPCAGVAPGDLRTCTPAFTTCDESGQQVCGPQGWSTCQASIVGDERPCSTVCGDDVQQCQADGTWGPCGSVARGASRTCTGPDCSGTGFQLCGSEGWGSCVCEARPKRRCGCGAAEGGTLAVEVVALWCAARRRVLAGLSRTRSRC